MAQKDKTKELRLAANGREEEEANLSKIKKWTFWGKEEKMPNLLEKQTLSSLRNPEEKGRHQMDTLEEMHQKNREGKNS